MIMIARRSSLLRHLAWAATLAIGFGTLWSVLVAWLGTAILEIWQGETRPPYESLVVRSDGTLLIQRNPRGYQSSWTYRDLKGQIQDTPERDDQIAALLMGGEPEKPGFLSPRLDWRSRLSVFLNEREPDVNWFFVHDGNPEDGAGYFVGYNRLSNRRVGFIGMSGFRAEPVPQADWIPMRGTPVVTGLDVLGEQVESPTRSLGCAAALGLFVVRNQLKEGRPRSTDRRDRPGHTRPDRDTGGSQGGFLVGRPLLEGTDHSCADDAGDP
jgi:hypothetical protein